MVTVEAFEAPNRGCRQERSFSRETCRGPAALRVYKLVPGPLFVPNHCEDATGQAIILATPVRLAVPGR